MNRLSILPLAALACSAEITNVRAIGATATQAVLAYTAPDSSPCSVAVSQSAGYMPLVHDVNAALFPGSDQDSRTEKPRGYRRIRETGIRELTHGRERKFVIGSRTAELAADGKYYSRALQAETTHYYKITCGAEAAEGSFRTASPPWGNTYPEIYPALPGGGYGWPDLDFTAGINQKLIDPQTGILFNSITQPGWFATAPRYVDSTRVPRGVFDDSAHANWVITADDLPASWTGDGANNPMLYIAMDGTSAYSTFGPSYGVYPSSEGRAFDYLRVTLTGGATGIGEDAKVQVCLTVDGGVSCAPGSIVEQDLTACGSTCTIGSNEGGLATWFAGKAPNFSGQDLSARTTVCSYDDGSGVLTRTSGHYFGERITAGSRVWIDGAPYKVLATGGPNSITIQSGLAGTIGPMPTTVFHPFGILIWKKTTTPYQVSISSASFRLGVSYAANYWSGADPRTCHESVVQYSGREGYHCHIPSNALALAWIDAETGEANLLGHLYAPSSGEYDGGGVAAFGETADTFYGVLSKSGKRRLVRCQYTGDNSPVAENKFTYGNYPTGFNTTCTSLTPGAYDLDALILSFDPRYIAAQFPTASAYNITNGLVPINITSGQDNVPGAWIVLLDPRITPGPGVNPVVAAYPTSGVQNPYVTPSRGCTNHGLKDIGNSDWTLITANNPSWAGMGIFGTTLAADLPVGATSLVLSAPAAFDQYRMGDVLRINSTAEYLLVTAVTDATHYVVQRGYKGTAQLGYTSGQAVGMWCKVNPQTGAGGIWWKHTADPHAYNATGATVLGDVTMPGGHRIFRSDVFIHASGGSAACKGLTSSACLRARFGALDRTIGQDVNVVLPLYSRFANKPSSGATFETHASMDNGQASTPAYFMDYHQITGWYTSTTPSAVGGSLYKFTKSLSRKHLPTMAFAGRHPLLDVSGPASSISGEASDKYKYCVVLHAGECYAGSNSGEIFFNVPYLGVNGCAVGESTNAEPSPDVCINDPEASLGRIVQNSLNFGISGDPNARRFLTGFQGRYRPQVRLDGTNGKLLPNGRIGIYEARYVGNYQTTIFTFRMPEGGHDSVNRSTFVPVTVELGSVPVGTHNAIAEFGYDTNFYCTSRQEPCVSVTGGSTAQPVNETTPFYWASESFTGVPCAAGCTLTIPAIAQRVVYYRLKYRDAGGTVIATGETRVAVTP